MGILVKGMDTARAVNGIMTLNSPVSCLWEQKLNLTSGGPGPGFSQPVAAGGTSDKALYPMAITLFHL